VIVDLVTLLTQYTDGVRCVSQKNNRYSVEMFLRIPYANGVLHD